MKKLMTAAVVALAALTTSNVMAADLDKATESAAYGVKQKADEAAAKIQHNKANKAYDEGRYGDAIAAKAKEYKNDVTAKNAEWNKEDAAEDAADRAEDKADNLADRREDRQEAIKDAKDSLKNLKKTMAD